MTSITLPLISTRKIGLAFVVVGGFFCLFLSRFCFVFWNFNTIEERKKELVVIMVLYSCFYMIMQHINNMQALILQGEWMNIAIFSICLQSWGFRNQNIWSSKRQYDFIDRYLLGSFTEKMFKEMTRVSHATFKFLCKKLGPIFF